MNNPLLLVILYFFLILSCQAQKKNKLITKENTKKPVFYNSEGNWADSVLKTLSVEEKIGQLMMVAAYSNKGSEHEQEILSLIKKQKIGGLIFFKGGPMRQAIHTNKYQNASKTPLMLAIDGEWGLAMRLDSTTRFPRQMLLGAIQNDSLIYEMAKEIGRQCEGMGLHINFAPVVDINNNPKNPVIGSRSFGEQPLNVSKKGEAYMNGLQDAGILANAKHFPGHGDTDSDSHHSLPIIHHTRNRLDSIELSPFKHLFKKGLGSIMVAHLYIPKIDSTTHQASTLSKKFVTEILKKELKFQGLIFTDALNMKGVSKYHKPGEVDLKAFLAGNDVMLFSEDVPLAIEKIKQAINDSLISEKDLNKRCKKVLLAKEWFGLHKNKNVDTTNLYKKVKTKKGEALNYLLAQNALTVLKNDSIFPIENTNQKIAYLNIGADFDNSFFQSIKRYANITQFQMNKSSSSNEQERILTKLKKYNLVIVGLHNPSRTPKNNFGITTSSINFIKKLAQEVKTISVLFANPYAGKKFEKLDAIRGFVVAYEDTKYCRDRAGQLVFGGIQSNGKLPVTMNKFFKAGFGINQEKKIRLGYLNPLEIGIDSKKLNEIDNIVKESIDSMAFPGCQIIAIKDENVFYNKSFGYLTYQKKNKVNKSTIYDLASITKIVASTLSLMKLVDENKIDINKTLQDYIPEIVNKTPYSKILLKDILTHQSGLQSWIPFYLETIKDKETYKKYYSSFENDEFNTKVADKMYISSKFKDTILSKILEKKLRQKKYKYSDLGYYFIKEIIEKITNQQLEIYVEKTFYKPMALRNISYNPKKKKYPHKLIAPTEKDTLFRKQEIRGYVHDMGAAMLGGVGGHAGVFSTANDLAVIFQMFLNFGNYGGKQIIDTTTIKTFTKCHYCPENRRGLGFDKPVVDLDGGPTSEKVSLKSFGHTGFTGTMAWVDPNNGINYIFLSNRTFPDMENRKIIKMNVRTKIQDVIYEALQPTK